MVFHCFRSFFISTPTACLTDQDIADDRGGLFRGPSTAAHSLSIGACASFWRDKKPCCGSSEHQPNHSTESIYDVRLSVVGCRFSIVEFRFFARHALQRCPRQIALFFLFSPPIVTEAQLWSLNHARVLRPFWQLPVQGKKTRNHFSAPASGYDPPRVQRHHSPRDCQNPQQTKR